MTKDRAALEARLRSRTPALRRRIAARIPERHRAVLSADDVLQQTFTDAFLDAERFTGDDDAFSAWLARIAEHNLQDALRMLDAEKRGGGVSPRAADDTSFETLFLDVLGRTTTSPSAGAARAEAAETMRRLVARLPEPHRVAITLIDLEGRGVETAAKALDRSVGATWLVRNRALKKLGRWLGG